jgi:hypothetical protein
MIDRNQPLSLRGLNAQQEQVKQSRNMSGAGFGIDSSVGNPIIIAQPGLKRYCTARLVDYAYEYSGGGYDYTKPPLTDANGYLLYQWVEEQQGSDGNGNPVWFDCSDLGLDGYRGSMKPDDPNNPVRGQWLNLAREANGWPTIPCGLEGGIPSGTHVIMWAGLEQDPSQCPTGQGGFTHLFYDRMPIVFEWWGSLLANLSPSNTPATIGFPNDGGHDTLCYNDSDQAWNTESYTGTAPLPMQLLNVSSPTQPTFQCNAAGFWKVHVDLTPGFVNYGAYTVDYDGIQRLVNCTGVGSIYQYLKYDPDVPTVYLSVTNIGQASGAPTADIGTGYLTIDPPFQILPVEPSGGSGTTVGLEFIMTCTRGCQFSLSLNLQSSQWTLDCNAHVIFEYIAPPISAS